MNHAPKVGDKFKLGGWVFEVQEWNKDDRRFISYSDNGMRYLVLWKGDASSLDWIEEPVTATISQEACGEIEEWIDKNKTIPPNIGMGNIHSYDIKSFIRSMIK